MAKGKSAVVETTNETNVNNVVNEVLMSEDFNLGDIPDLSGIGDSRPEFQPFVDGWYAGTILEKREFTDKNGNDRVFESNDTPAQRSGRNIRLQVVLTRKDGQVLNIGSLINYNPADLTAETVKAVAKRKEENAAGDAEWGDLFRSFMTLTRLGKLQKIAGVRQLQRTSDGGLDLSPLYGKSAYFRIKPDDRNAQYKQIADFQSNAPKNLL
jgi:hypothetical protein